MELDAAADHDDFVYVDEVDINLAIKRCGGRNRIEHRTILNVPGQHGGNTTTCAAISRNYVLHHRPTLSPSLIPCIL